MTRQSQIWLAAVTTVLVQSSLASAQIVAGLQGYWHFDGTGADSSGNGRDLSLVGSPGFGAGLFGQSLSLTGDATQYATRPVNDAIFDVGGGNFTIQVWVNFNTTGGEQTLFEKFTGAGGPGYTVTKLAANDIRFATGNMPDVDTATLTIPTGVWHEFVVRRAGNSLDILFDGSIAASATVSGAIDTSPNPLLIGRRDGNQQYPVNGRMDEVAFWNRALSNTELAAVYNGGNGMLLSSVPEPGSLLLCGVAAAFMCGRRLARLCNGRARR